MTKILFLNLDINLRFCFQFKYCSTIKDKTGSFLFVVFFKEMKTSSYFPKPQYLFFLQTIPTMSFLVTRIFLLADV